jgi:hypothetical protein
MGFVPGYYGHNRIFSREDIEEAQTFHGPMTDKDYTSHAAMVEAEHNFALQHRTRTPEEEALENMSADEIRPILENYARGEAAIIKRTETQADIAMFLAGHPELPDTDHNAWEIRQALELLGVDASTATLDEFEEIYARLRQTDRLQLNKKIVAEQAAAANKSKHAAYLQRQQSQAFNEEDAYSMSMEELRRKAGGTGGGWF